MKKLFFFVVVAIIMSACSNSGTKTQTAEPVVKNEVVITNDLENAMAIIPSWLNEKTIIAMKEPPAHSGVYACITNDTIQYSYAYNELIKNIDSRTPKMVVYSGWIYTTVANPNYSIICSTSENNQQISWGANPLASQLSEVNKWVEFSTSFYFDKNKLTPEEEIKMYGWNQSKKPVYIDDLKIMFIY